MSKDKKKKTRAEPKKMKKRERDVVSWLCSPEAYDTLTCEGYTSLAQNPEIISAVQSHFLLLPGTWSVQSTV